MNIHTLLSVTVASLLAAGCQRESRVIIETAPPDPTPLPVARTETLETRVLGREIDTFEQTPSTVQAARVKKAFAEIDGEIAELVEYVAKKTGDGRAEAARKLANLRTYREAEHARFLRLEAKAPLPEPIVTGLPARPRGEGTAERIGESIDKAARKVEESVKDAAEAVREKTR